VINKIAVIIPDRGDRPEFTNHCLMQIDRQTRQPDKVYHVNYPPVDDSVDIVPRVRKGVEMAKRDNCTHAYIFENDDYYPDTYIENMSFDGSQFIGINITCYYSIITSSYAFIPHSKGSSLFCTAFKVSALDNFTWPDDSVIYLDQELWQYARDNLTISIKEMDRFCMPVGIKHGIGKCAGSFHGNDFNEIGAIQIKDDNNKWLRSMIRPESMKLYNKINGT